MSDVAKIAVGIIVLIPCASTIVAFWFLVFKSIANGAFVNYPVRKKDIANERRD